jgi:hypothetical protein
MLMEAVMMSLKDLEVPNPKAEQPPASSDANVTVESSDKESSLVIQSTDSKSITISTASEETVPLKAEPNTIAAKNLMSEASLIGGAQPPPPQVHTLSVTESSNTSGSGRSDSSASLQSSSDADISHNTKATVTVVRNPAGHVMDGLMRRWDFNFFKNSNNR